MTVVSCGGGSFVSVLEKECVCVLADCMRVSTLRACVTSEQEPGSKEHMFRVLLRPVL